MYTGTGTSRTGRLILTLAATLFTMAGCSAVADGNEVTLTGTEEVPAVTTEATGKAAITVKDDRSVVGSIRTSGITGTMAHIHQAAAGVNGPVIVTLEGKGGNEWVVPQGTRLTTAQFQAYESGDLYVNVHSSAHPDGEMRAQLSP